MAEFWVFSAFGAVKVPRLNAQKLLGMSPPGGWGGSDLGALELLPTDNTPRGPHALKLSGWAQQLMPNWNSTFQKRGVEKMPIIDFFAV